jgi:kynurenine formamidase
MSDSDVTWPHHELGKELSNWGRWGDDDQIGTLNFITPEKLVRAAQLIRTGKIIDCGIPFDKNGPFPPGGWRNNPQHVFTLLPSDSFYAKDGQIAADDLIIMGLQASTQWDGLAHVGYDGFFYNGVPAAAVNNFQGASKNDIAKVAPKLISRGVLLDIAALKGVDALPDSYEITEADVLAAEERQGVRVESGDIVCIRTGWYKYFAEGDRQHYVGNTAGPGQDICRWIHDREIAALALDQANGEAWPTPIPGATIPFHQVVIRDIGLTLGEMFNFNDLAADCEQDGVWVRPSPRWRSSRRRADDQLRGRLRGGLHHRRGARPGPGRGRHRRHYGALHAGRGPRSARYGQLRGRGRDPRLLGQVEAPRTAAAHAGQRRYHRLGRRAGPGDHRRGVHRPGGRRLGDPDRGALLRRVPARRRQVAA